LNSNSNNKNEKKTDIKNNVDKVDIKNNVDKVDIKNKVKKSDDIFPTSTTSKANVIIPSDLKNENVSPTGNVMGL
jgi:hypothetical protein